MRPIDKLLPQLEKVRPRGSSSWMACCPAHPDKNPSLSIKETEDGDVLLHCFAGCGADEVMAALGLNLADLYDKPITDYRVGPTPSRFTAEDVLIALASEIEDAYQISILGNQDAARIDQISRHLSDGLSFIKRLYANGKE